MLHSKGFLVVVMIIIGILPVLNNPDFANLINKKRMTSHRSQDGEWSFSLRSFLGFGRARS